MQKYEILDIIDQGAYGIVWKAVNKQTQQFVAIKQFKESDQDQQTKKTIQREIKMLKMLKGDYIVGIREAFKKKGKIYLIFEYFPKNLLNLIQQCNQGLQPSSIKQIVYKAVKCLRFLHNKNILHRDIKPENILLNQDNKTLKLCDLGFARFIPQHLNEMTDYVATRWYRSPQLLVGEPYNKPADMFALGCIIGQLVDGQPMFPGQDEIDQIFLLKKALGQLTSNQHRYLFDNHKFSGIQIPQVKKRQTLQERYLGKIQKNALSFMKACLKMNAEQRITAQQALKHPYLVELSMKDKFFENDEQNLLSNDRKTVLKNVSRASMSSLLKQEDYCKNVQDSVILTKNKSFSKAQKNLRVNYGSIDHRSNTKMQNNRSNFVSNQMLLKKTSHQAFVKPKQVSPNVFQKDQKGKKSLKKHMSEQKHLKVNLDVNVNINFKFNKKMDEKKLIPPQTQANGKGPKFPELKPNPKGYTRGNKDILAGLSRRLGHKQFSVISKKQFSHQWSEQRNNKKFTQQKAYRPVGELNFPQQFIFLNIYPVGNTRIITVPGTTTLRGSWSILSWNPSFTV